MAAYGFPSFRFPFDLFYPFFRPLQKTLLDNAGLVMPCSATTVLSSRAGKSHSGSREAMRATSISHRLFHPTSRSNSRLVSTSLARSFARLRARSATASKDPRQLWLLRFSLLHLRCSTIKSFLPFLLADRSSEQKSPDPHLVNHTILYQFFRST